MIVKERLTVPDAEAVAADWIAPGGALLRQCPMRVSQRNAEIKRGFREASARLDSRVTASAPEAAMRLF